MACPFVNEVVIYSEAAASGDGDSTLFGCLTVRGGVSL